MSYGVVKAIEHPSVLQNWRYFQAGGANVPNSQHASRKDFIASFTSLASSGSNPKDATTCSIMLSCIVFFRTFWNTRARIASNRGAMLGASWWYADSKRNESV